MTTALTHGQAAVLRAIDGHEELFDRNAVAKSDLSRWLGICFIGWDGDTCLVLNGAGREALAEYDRENATVLKDDIEVALRLVRLCMNSFIEKGMNNQDREALARLQAALESK